MLGQRATPKPLRLIWTSPQNRDHWPVQAQHCRAAESSVAHLLALSRRASAAQAVALDRKVQRGE